jgi:chaperonin GroES
MATAPFIEDQIQDEAPLIIRLAQHGGDLTQFFDSIELATIGSQVVEDYERDKTSRGDWATKVEEAQKAASQEGETEPKNYPFERASDIRYPILTIAATEFNARSYPAIVKGDETVQVKVIGSDKGRPLIGQDGQQMVTFGGEPLEASTAMARVQEAEAIAQQSGQQIPPAQPAWERPPGFKTKRAARVKEYLNVLLNYRMDDWEGDTDSLLYQLPIVGCAFRKVWWDNGKQMPCSRYVPALRLVVPMDALSLATTPRATEEMPDVFPYQIRQRMARGEYRRVDLGPSGGGNSGDDEAARMLLEQHRLIDLDEDGYEEPYIITVDRETREVLSIVAAFDVDDIEFGQEGVENVERSAFYIKYDFLPHPEGKFYGIGFGHLLSELSAVINTAINQMIDAGHAQIAGGGFISSGLRLQGNGQTNTLRWRPGEYKNVNVAPGLLQGSIFERTLPPASNIMFSVLEMMLGAAKDVAAIKDVTSGDASNNGQVGTTLALIEQGLQVFTAIYKRVYRAERQEFGLIFKLVGRYGGEKTAKDYLDVLDDVEADFRADFDASDMDIRPVSDPTSITRLQKVARAQFLLQTGVGDPNVDQRELKRRVFEAADVEDLDTLLPPPNPDAPPSPDDVKTLSEAARNDAQASLYRAQEAEIGARVGKEIGAAESGGPEPEMTDAA